MRFVALAAVVVTMGLGGVALAQPAGQARAMEAVRTALHLEPGDERVMAEALRGGQIEAWVSVAGDRELSGQIVVRTAAGGAARVARASRRVGPSVARRSDFVQEFVLDVPAGVSEAEFAAMLMATGDYAYAEPNWWLFPVDTVPNDPEFKRSWQHDRIQSAKAWDLNTGSSEVIVAVCDSGVDLDHPDLMAALVPGYHTPSQTAQADGGDVEDVNGHGTFVAGCAAAIGNNGAGVVGAGWNFRIMPVRVTNLSSGSASGFDLVEGARWAAAHGAHVVNVSYSGVMGLMNEAAARDVRISGGVLFWAAGNSNARIDGNRPALEIIAATTSSDNKASFSNFGTAIDVGSPGSGVRSTTRGGGYGNSSGTSFASPIAAGVGAMIFSANSLFAPEDVQEILHQSADDLGPVGFDDSFGNGRVNTFVALQIAQSWTPRVPVPLTEGFEQALSMHVWPIASGVELVADAGAPEGTQVAVLDGTDTLESGALLGDRLRFGPALTVLSVSARHSGVEAGERLTVALLDVDIWMPMIELVSDGVDHSRYRTHEVLVPIEMRQTGMKIRVVASGDEADDDWMIDTLSLVRVIPEQPIPFADDFESGALRIAQWDLTTTASVVRGPDGFEAELGDGEFFETVDVRMRDEGLVTQFVHLFTRESGTAAGDSLLLEYRDIDGDWWTLVSYAAAESSFSVLRQIPVPFVGLGNNDFRLRVTASSPGGGVWLVDDLYLGPDELTATPPCSPADLAEPFGVLDFFDVSEFLVVFGSNDPAADLNGDGVIDFFDVSEFLTLFAAGCP